MSLVYCRECDRMIDLDWDTHDEHFLDNFDKAFLTRIVTNEVIKKLKGGKNDKEN